MADISQSLGFDVSQVLSGLKSADQAINVHIGELKKLQQAYNGIKGGNFNKATQGATNFGQSVQKAGSQSAAAAGKIKGATATANQLGGALDGLTSKVVFANAISRAATFVRQALAQAIEGAVDFQRGLAEIQTIAPQFQGNMDGLAASVKELSDEFNSPLGNVTEGLYQTISNQVQGAAAQFDVLTTSLKFAKVTASSTESSVALITGALNGFRISASESETVAAKLFKTIELGRTRADQLSGSLGRLSKLASQVGVSLDETLAGIATITISAVSTSEAITQMRGAFNALIKPTTEMTDAIQRMGFASSEQAIEVLGFQEVLKQLEESTGGSTEALSELFPRVRGLSGVLNLAGKDAETYAANIDKIGKATQDSLNESYKIVIETDAEQATKRINEFRNFLIDDFGGAALSTFNQIGDGFDTLASVFDSTPLSISSNASSVLAGLVESAPAATAALIAFAASAKIASTATSAFGANAGLLAGSLTKVIGVAALVLAGLNAIDGAVQANIDSVRQSYDRTFTDLQDTVSQQAKEQIDIERQKWDIIGNATREGIGAQIKEYNRQINSIRQSAKSLQGIFSSSVGGVFSAREGVADALAAGAKNARGNSTDAGAEQTKLLIDLEDTLFDRSVGRLDAAKAYNQVLNRSVDLGQKAASALASAKTDDQKDAADATFSRAFALEAQALALAKQSGSQAKIAASSRQLQSLTESRVQALKQYARVQDSVAQKAAKEAAAQAESNKQFKQRFADLASGPKLTDENDRPLNPEDTKKAIDEFNERRKSFASEALEVDLTIGEFVNLSESLAALQSAVDAAQVDGSKFEKIAADQNAAFKKVFESEDVQVVVDFALTQAGKTIESPDEILSGFREAFETVRVRVELQADIDNAVTEINKSITDAVGFLNAQTEAARFNVRQLADPGRDGDSVTRQFDQTIQALNELNLDGVLNGATLDAEKLDTVLKSVNETLTKYDQKKVSVFTPGQAEAAENLKVRLKSVIEAQEEIKQKEAELKDIDVKIKTSLEDSDLDASVSQAAQSIGGLASAAIPLQTTLTNAPTGLIGGITSANNQIGSAIVSANNLAQAFRNAASAAASISPGGGSGSSDTAAAYHGGFIHRASGGPARGNDNINAVLSRGEYVVNARNARRFAPEISAMNAGVKPAFRNSGGDVSNTTNVGDIYVNVDGNNGASGTARDIATNLRREVRRGTSRI